MASKLTAPANEKPAVSSTGGLRVFLTGASSGIGMAFARHYAARGATLGLLARRQEVLQELAQELKQQYGVDVHCYGADVADAQAVGAAARDFLQQAGVPDVVIANAG
ncbi:MAG TPA: SDR family NAD(P)-dependent oxidoreductase, partial [Rhodocyclaceae bacterium]|nr:SDR family NAD(P)-dependent oxidoreductase [Rhodocyclaceae bacterium]